MRVYPIEGLVTLCAVEGLEPNKKALRHKIGMTSYPPWCPFRVSIFADSSTHYALRQLRTGTTNR